MNKKQYFNPSDLHKIELRMRAHWSEQKAKYPMMSDWSDYFRVNWKYALKNAKMFNDILTPDNFDKYLDDPEINPWTLYNIQTMNG